MGKLGNRVDNTVSIPGRSIHTIALGGTDVINTVDGVAQDITSLVLNTKNKIANLFSKELKRYEKALNIPVAAGVGLAGAVEAAVKPVVNTTGNVIKTATNFISNALKSTFGSLFSTKPVSDISYNTLKRKGEVKNIDTKKPVRSRESLWTESWGFLTPEKKKSRLEKKKAKIESLISKL